MKETSIIKYDDDDDDEDNHNHNHSYSHNHNHNQSHGANLSPPRETFDTNQ